MLLAAQSLVDASVIAFARTCSPLVPMDRDSRWDGWCRPADGLHRCEGRWGRQRAVLWQRLPASPGEAAMADFNACQLVSRKRRRPKRKWEQCPKARRKLRGETGTFLQPLLPSDIWCPGASGQ